MSITRDSELSSERSFVRLAVLLITASWTPLVRKISSPLLNLAVVAPLVRTWSYSQASVSSLSCLNKPAGPHCDQQPLTRNGDCFSHLHRTGPFRRLQPVWKDDTDHRAQVEPNFERDGRRRVRAVLGRRRHRVEPRRAGGVRRGTEFAPHLRCVRPPLVIGDC